MLVLIQAHKKQVDIFPNLVLPLRTTQICPPYLVRQNTKELRLHIFDKTSLNSSHYHEFYEPPNHSNPSNEDIATRYICLPVTTLPYYTVDCVRTIHLGRPGCPPASSSLTRKSLWVSITQAHASWPARNKATAGCCEPAGHQAREWTCRTGKEGAEAEEQWSS